MKDKGDYWSQVLSGAVTCSECGSQIKICENQYGDLQADPCEYCLEKNYWKLKAGRNGCHV